MISKRKNLKIDNRDFGEIMLDSLLEHINRCERPITSYFLSIWSDLKTLRACLKYLKEVRSFVLRILIFALIVGLQGSALLSVGETRAFYSDTESSSSNLFKAALLDFRLTENEFETFIGKEALGEYSVASVALPEPDSLDIQYIVSTEKTSGDDDLCVGLDLEATQNGIEIYDNDFLSFTAPTTTVFGTWEFEFDLPPSVTNVGHGDVCNTDVVFYGWRADSMPEDSGYDDEERMSFSFTSKMVLMNEMLPHPDPLELFPNDTEWVELYNNGDTAIDVAGWIISELSNPQDTPSENFYTIVASSPGVGEVTTFSGSTIISAGGFLVIVFDVARMNNTGDTITFYDSSLNQLDQHSYTGAEAPEGKSIARIPDGIGAWVDPIPTPGAQNIDGDIEDESIQIIILESTVDITPPEITINGNNPAVIEIETNYNDLSAYAYDDVDGQRFVDAEGDIIDTSSSGEYIVTYRAMDSSFNILEAYRVVVVYNPLEGEPTLPEVPTPQNVTVVPEEIIPEIVEDELKSSEPEDEIVAEPETPKKEDEPVIVEEIPENSDDPIEPTPDPLEEPMVPEEITPEIATTTPEVSEEPQEEPVEDETPLEEPLVEEEPEILPEPEPEVVPEEIITDPIIDEESE